MTYLIPSRMTEAELTRHVVAYCKDLDLLRFHVHNSMRMEAGFPDEIIIGPGGLIWRELKREGVSLTFRQRQVGQRLTDAGQDWGVWRPSDLLSGRIVAELEAIA